MSFFHNQTMKQGKKSRGIEILEHLNIYPEEIFHQSRVTMNLFEIASVMVITVSRMFFVSCVQELFFCKK